MSRPTERTGSDRRALLERAERDDPRTAVTVRSYEFEDRHLVELRGTVDGEECSRSSYVVSPGDVVHDAIPGRVEVLEATLAAGTSTSVELGDASTVLVEVGNGAVSVTPGDRLGDGESGTRDALVQ